MMLLVSSLAVSSCIHKDAGNHPVATRRRLIKAMKFFGYNVVRKNGSANSQSQMSDDIHIGESRHAARKCVYLVDLRLRSHACMSFNSSIKLTTGPWTWRALGWAWLMQCCLVFLAQAIQLLYRVS